MGKTLGIGAIKYRSSAFTTNSDAPLLQIAISLLIVRLVLPG
jgi:hypothetical protein